MRFASLFSYLSLLACAHAHIADTRHAGKVHRDNHFNHRAVHAPYNGTSGSSSLRVPTPTTSGLSAGVTIEATAAPDASYWLEDIKHQGIAAFNSDPSSYTVFRNVKDYGAKGIYR